MYIEVGEYVRTKNGEIAIFRGYNERKTSQWIYKLEFQKKKFPKYCAEGYITNHSKNIVDLIEPGDYINGNKVLQKIGNFLEVSSCDIGNNRIYDYMIKSILTKQQFSNMEYRL